GPFELEMLTPAILGEAAPAGHELTAFDERRYAAFCRAFSEAATRRILRHDPRDTAVLVNDISEAPDFPALKRAGFRITTIYHVDVVAYIAAIYLRGWAGARALAGAWRAAQRLGAARFSPLILRLIFERQQQSLLHSSAIVVPSSGMKRILLESWPEAREDRIHVLPWGAPPVGSAQAPADADALRREFAVQEGEKVLLALSRISPEKGQDLLLESLFEWERARGAAVPPLRLFVCGAPAYMQGRAHMARLERLAARLRRIRVDFPGHVTGARKQAFFTLADLFVFASRHESYGLTLMEALAAGLPAVAVESDGTREILRPELGVLVQRGQARQQLWRAIEALLGDDARRASMSRAARGYAAGRPFSKSAARLAEICAG
ncbi:MAG: glycosyltransferase family 4 protein, partial [Bryobacteraceae bacterium]|nr:glycosyltransferase family 4 protein [Bryobacteraceae bacterium]